MADEFDSELSGIKQMFIDLDGDGRPDIAVPAPGRSVAGRGTPGAELTSSNTQSGDYYGERFGPAVGSAVSAVDRGARAVGNFMYGMTGIPSAEKAGESAAKFSQNGDWRDAAAAAGQGALAVAPFAAGMRGAGGAINVLARPGKAGATFGAAGLLSVPQGVGEAQAVSREKSASAIERDPIVLRLRQELQAAQAALSSANDPRKNYPSTRARELAVVPYQQAIDALLPKITEAETAAASGYQQNAPFRERNPGAAETIMGVSGAVAGTLPLANTIKANLADRLVLQPSIMRTAGKVEQAAFGGRNEPGVLNRLTGGKAQNVKPNEAQFGIEQATLQNKLSHRAASEPSMATNMALSAGILQEGRMLPEEIDAIVYPYDHPTRQAATTALSDPSYYASGVIPSVLGGVALGGGATKVGNVLTKGANPELNRAAVMATMPFPQRPGQQAPPANGPIPMPAPQPAQLPAPQQVPPPGLQRPIGPGSQGSTRGSYGPQEQGVVRPFVSNEVAAGRNVPDVSAMQGQLNTAGMNRPLPATMDSRQINAQAIVDGLRAQGVPDAQIASLLTNLMSGGRGKFLPGAAAVGAGFAGTMAPEQPTNMLAR